MTIAKNTKKAKQILANAHAVLCYSLEGHFEAKPLCDRPVVWDNGSIVEVTIPEFLTRELDFYHAKLTSGERGLHTLHVHSNLWYTFAA